MRRKFVLTLFFVIIGFPLAAFAQEPAWWTRMKAECRARGGNISDYYNSYTGCHIPSQPQPSRETQSAPQAPGPNLRLENGKWVPDDGYEFITPGNYQVRWVPHRRSKKYPNVFTGAVEREFYPAAGYDWVLPGSPKLIVRWVPNRRHPKYPKAISTEIKDRWEPEDGYEFTSLEAENYIADWRPGIPSKKYPNVFTADREGEWRAEDGYLFVNPGELIVVEDGKVNEAIRQARRVYNWENLKEALKPKSGFEHQGRIEAALKILASAWVLHLPTAASRADREILIQRTRKELEALIKDVVQTTVLYIRNDIEKVTPFYWNPFSAGQRVRLAEMADDVSDVGARAGRALNGSGPIIEVRSGSDKSALQYASGAAFEQLLHLVTEKKWTKR
jgi:hypothetical protein